MTVANVPTYASELFGAGHVAIKYPEGKAPVVTLTIPGDLNARVAAGADTPADATDDRDACAAFSHDGEALVTFTLSAGKFAGNVTGLMWDPDTTDTGTGTGPRAAPGAVASIEDGGQADGNSMTIKIGAATNASAPANTDTARSSESVAVQDVKACMAPADHHSQSISFEVPRLKELDGALKGAGAKPKDVKIHVVSRVVSGSFTDGRLSKAGPNPKAPGETVVVSRDSLTLKVTATGDKTIALKDDASKGLTAFKSVKEKTKDGYVHLATVMIATQQVSKAAAAPTGQELKYLIDSDGAKATTGDNAGRYEAAQAIYVDSTSGNDTMYHTLLDLDGKDLDEGLRGNFMVNAMGTRGLFNEDDMLFVDYDGDGKMGGSERIDLDGDMGVGKALSIDPDESESFPDGVNGSFNVWYMPGGKIDINHGSMINLTAMVDYSDPSAIDETPAKSSTTMNFDGVTSEVMAYAIPFDGNGKGDKANVRVRCEASAGCRVFVECWDDMGMRSFGEAGMIAGNALTTWNSMDIESVLGVEEATTRHSCRILSAGMVTVQQLTRDGSSGTLVNNTYVGE